MLREQWRTTGDTRDQRDRERHRPRGSHRDRGGRYGKSDRGRRRQKDGRPGPPFRSPPPRSFAHPDDDERRRPREFSPGAASARGSPGPSLSESKHRQKPPFHRSPDQAEFADLDPSRHREAERPTERDYRRDDSPSAPPPKRKRTRSPSPGGPPRHSNHPSHRYPGDDFDRGFPFKKRGRFPGRGRSGRRSPRRGRERRKNEGGRRPPSPRPRRSRSPLRGSKTFNYPRRRFHSPRPEDDLEEESRYRSVSRHSVQSGDSRFSYGSRRDSVTMNPGRPVRSVTDESLRSPSPARPIPSFTADYAAAPADGDNPREPRGRRSSDAPSGQQSRPTRPRADSRQYSASPQYTPSNSFHGSPQPSSPYSAGRGGWGGQQRSYHGQSG